MCFTRNQVFITPRASDTDYDETFWPAVTCYKLSYEAVFTKIHFKIGFSHYAFKFIFIFAS